MSYRIAAASSDGKVVNQHFGRATKFLIFEVIKGQFKFLELRETQPFCIEYSHDEDRLKSAAEALSDCRAVVVAKIGNGAVQALRSKGVEAFDNTDLIDESIKKIIKYYERIDNKSFSI